MKLEIEEECILRLRHPVSGKHYQMSYEPGKRKEAFKRFEEAIRASEATMSENQSTTKE